jgi:hypothetical protein
MNVLNLLYSAVFSVLACTNVGFAIDATAHVTPDGINKTVLDEGAKIVSVTVKGTSGDYRFSVGVSSPDTGCEQYADWWEVISTDGKLLYRRILGHSHVNEQPFVRSGSGIDIGATDEVIVRVHVNTLGYGTTAFKGSVASGFKKATIAANFAAHVLNDDPLPTGCAF